MRSLGMALSKKSSYLGFRVSIINTVFLAYLNRSIKWLNITLYR